MADPKREELKVKHQKAVLAAVIDPSEKESKNHALDELRGLVKTAGVEVVGTMVQIRENPHPAYCMGKGKLEELQLLARASDAELIVFDNNLSPSQGRNIERETDTVIVDRSEIILDIFASRAQTYEARLQVELAQLLYFRPRLKRMWTHLERIEGGVGTGRGPGEKQLETDRRLIDKRLSDLRKKLREVEKRRERTVGSRNDQATVSLVGYTNAGKSTLMRRLTEADVLVADKLFATLDTRTRRWGIPHWGDVLLSDTVGFVRDLPHHLVASFKSTLEEARHADLLLHVVDASNPEAEKQIDTVNQVLDEIGVDTSNMIIALNKADAVEDRSVVDILRVQYDDAITLSASTGDGVDRLGEAVAKRLGDGFVEAEIEADVGDGKLHAYLMTHADVTETEYTDSRVKFRCRIARRLAEHLNSGDESVIVRAS